MSTRKGHHYVTVGVDRESECVIYVNEGKGKQAVQAIGKHLQLKGAQAEQIQQVSMELNYLRQSRRLITVSPSKGQELAPPKGGITSQA
ncbi:hypothetical protein SAMN05421863_11532 [Nitrosomonas communis]|uniref:Uncharacterized protein n=1 Tax=Nitrosomonas communis TaxID=44574 RepID=A0A1I4XEC4_9PROT|nr:hypothetical protein SAMN05421863_11532 [Nitrosomonas communis]